MARGKSGDHPAPKSSQPLRVISEQDSQGRSVLMPSEDVTGPLIAYEGKGQIELTCGKCGEVLVTGLAKRGQILNMVLGCRACGALNDAGGSPDLN